MAKRVRGSRSTHRPGGQGPSRTARSAGGPAGDTERVTSVDTEEAIDNVFDAAEFEEVAELTIAETVAVEPAAPPRRSRQERRRTRTRPDDLEARMASENVWVREDLRRIGVVSLVLLAGLAIAWVLFVAVDLLGLY